MGADAEKKPSDDGPVLDLTSMRCTRCCRRVDWCRCRHRRRRLQLDGTWR